MGHAKRTTPALLAGALLLLGGLLAWQVWRGGRGGGAAGVPAPGTESAGSAASVALAPAEPGQAPERAAARAEGPRDAPASGAAAAAAGAGAEPFRGRLVDRATGEPVPFALLRAGAIECEVGADGRWRALGELPDGVGELEFHDPVHRSHIRTLSRVELVADADEGWLAPIEIGPTLRVRVLGVPDFDPLEFEARLLELPNERFVHIPEGNGFVPLRAGDPAWFRYDNPWQPGIPSHSYRIDVRERAGTRAGTSELFTGAPVGIRHEVVTVFVDQALASVSGRVVDAGGAPKQHATVELAQLGAVARIPAAQFAERAVETGDDGTFALRGIPPGDYWISARPRRGETPCARVVQLAAGTTDVGDLVVGAQVAAGMIEGRLESRAGRPLLGTVLVRMRAVGGAFEMFDTSSPAGLIGGLRGIQFHAHGATAADAPPEGSLVFEFNEAPAGLLELSVVSQDGYAWSPSAIRVTAPDAGAVFVREDAAPPAAFRFDVVDAEGGAALPSFAAEVSLGDALPKVWTIQTGERAFELPDRPFTWLVSAAGYRAAAGSERDFAAGDPRVATVRLARGFSARISVRDFGTGFAFHDEAAPAIAFGRPLVPGARIVADGRLVATAQDGTAWIDLDAEPERLAVELPGWRVVESDRFRGGRIQGSGRDVTVWMVRE